MLGSGGVDYIAVDELRHNTDCHPSESCAGIIRELQKAGKVDMFPRQRLCTNGTSDACRTYRAAAKSFTAFALLLLVGLGGRVIFYLNFASLNSQTWANRTELIAACAAGGCRLSFETCNPFSDGRCTSAVAFPCAYSAGVSVFVDDEARLTPTTPPATVQKILENFKVSLATNGGGNAVAFPTWGIGTNYDTTPGLDATRAQIAIARSAEPDWHGGSFYTPAHLPAAIASQAAASLANIIRGYAGIDAVNASTRVGGN